MKKEIKNDFNADMRKSNANKRGLATICVQFAKICVQRYLIMLILLSFLGTCQFALAQENSVSKEKLGKWQSLSPEQREQLKKKYKK